MDNPERSVELAERLVGKVNAEVLLFAARMKEGLLAASVAIGSGVMGELMDAEVTELAGPKGRHNTTERVAYRHGREDGAVVLGGCRLGVRRPRVRSVTGGEVHLESYDTFAEVDLLAEHTVAAMLAGLSTRRYPIGLEAVGEAVDTAARSTSHSAVSRRFVAATAGRLAEFGARDLSDRRWLVCFIDGFDFAGHTMVGALGVTADGTKVPLGVVEGSTENAAVVRGLVTSMRDRGVSGDGGLLFVLDGGKALHRAVTDVYGTLAVIQRCRLHKERNVADHLPEAERLWVKRKMRQAWRNPDAAEGQRDLEALARQLEAVNPDAAGSLREGLAEMFTVTRLGVTAALLRTLATNNPVESMNEIVRDHSRNVKRWQPGDMRLRWAAAGMCAAADQFRRVKGYRQLPRPRRRPDHRHHHSPRQHRPSGDQRMRTPSRNGFVTDNSCVVCGVALPAGRPRTTCSDRCRQAAWRRRHQPVTNHAPLNHCPTPGPAKLAPSTSAQSVTPEPSAPNTAKTATPSCAASAAERCHPAAGNQQPSKNFSPNLKRLNNEP